MIRAFLYNRANRELSTGGAELCGQWRQGPDTLLWLDLVDEAAGSEQQLLRQEFGLHPLAIQDAQRDRHPPKLEAFTRSRGREWRSVCGRPRFSGEPRLAGTLARQRGAE